MFEQGSDLSSGDFGRVLDPKGTVGERVCVWVGVTFVARVLDVPVGPTGGGSPSGRGGKGDESQRRRRDEVSILGLLGRRSVPLRRCLGPESGVQRPQCESD